MTDCVIVQPIASCGVELLKNAGLSVFEADSMDLAALKPHLKNAKAVITRNKGFSAEAIDASPKLAIIASHGTGTDKIAHAAANKRGIRIVNTPGSNANSVAEHAISLMFACARQILTADNAVRLGDWSIRERTKPREISKFRIGLVGYGHVAQKLAVLVRGLGMSIFVYSKSASDYDLSKVGAKRILCLEELLAVAQIISLHGLPGKTPILNERLLSKMSAETILINTARAALIDEIALVKLLREGRIAAAGLDVFSDEPLPDNSPLLNCPNLILTPHMGGVGVEAMNRTSREVALKIIEGLGIASP